MYAKRVTKRDMLNNIEGPYKSAKVDRSKKATLCVTYEDGTREVWYHRTCVVKHLPNGNTVLNSGGFHTKTTKDRMNDHMPCGYITQRQYEWYYSPYGGEEIPFFDGIEITPDGEVVNRPDTSAEEAALQERKELLARIKKFCNQLKKLTPEEWANLKPDPGDCWVCKGVFGDPQEGHCGHLASHLKENYMHGTLIMNAMHKYDNAMILMHYLQEGAPQCARFADRYARALEKYLRAALVK